MNTLRSAVLFVLLTGLIGLALLAPRLSASHLPIRWIELSGNLSRVNDDQLRASLKPLLRAGFLGTDLNTVQARLEKLPWVARATVRKEWPDKLHVQIDEHEALARLSDGSLLSRDGQRFEVQGGSAMQGLPELSAPAARLDELTDRYLKFGALLARRGLVIERLSLSESGSWSVELLGGIELKLGRDDLDARLKRFADTYARLNVTDQRRPKRIDLRYANGYAVEWHVDANPSPDPIEQFMQSHAAATPSAPRT
jgi:cell division protein FtsQ